METPVFQFQINKDGSANVFIDGKEVRNITKIDISGIPRNFDVEISRFERDKDGNIVREPFLAKTTEKYHFEW